MKKDSIIIQIHFLLGFLIVEFLFGMFANLFIQFPNTSNKEILWTFAKNQFPVVMHMIIGALLIIGGIVLLIRTIRKKNKQLIISASVGLIALLAASFTGAQFVSTQQDWYSYTMAVMFIIAIISYGWGLLKIKK